MKTPIHQHPHLNGFTLIEILVAIALVAVVASLLIGAVVAMRGTADESHARTQLGGLIGVSAEYETATTMPVLHDSVRPSLIFTWDQAKRQNAPGFTGTALIQDPGATTAEEYANLFSERFVWAAYQLPATREALERLGEGMLVDLDEDGFLEMRDPWGNNIAYATFSNHSSLTTDDFLPQHTNPFFASAGADGKWGAAKTESELGGGAAWTSYIATDDYIDSRDNLYSFDLDRTSENVGQ